VNTPSHPSNVARFARAISPVAIIKDSDGVEREVEQIVYYQPGVGTGAALADKITGGKQIPLLSKGVMMSWLTSALQESMEQVSPRMFEVSLMFMCCFNINAASDHVNSRIRVPGAQLGSQSRR
jgi:hypothetical protein